MNQEMDGGPQVAQSQEEGTYLIDQIEEGEIESSFGQVWIFHLINFSLGRSPKLQPSLGRNSNLLIAWKISRVQKQGYRSMYKWHPSWKGHWTKLLMLDRPNQAISAWEEVNLGLLGQVPSLQDKWIKPLLLQQTQQTCLCKTHLSFLLHRFKNSSQCKLRIPLSPMLPITETLTKGSILSQVLLTPNPTSLGTWLSQKGTKWQSLSRDQT